MTDFMLANSLLTPDEREIRERLRLFASEYVLPGADEAWERQEFRTHLVPLLAAQGVVGGTVGAYGCPSLSSVAYGLVALELARADSSFATFFGVHSSLAMGSIARCGSDQQKQRWLPPMARCEAIGAFALTEPDHGSDAAHLETTAVQEEDDWILNGVKRWIGNGTICDVMVVWARTADGIAGFLVEPTSPGFHCKLMTGKISKRGVLNAEITLRDCHAGAASRMPVGGFGTVAGILSNTRQFVAWEALGEAIACYDTSLHYAGEREQFGKPIAAFQLVQAKLVRMLNEITKAQLLCIQLGRLSDLGQMTDGMSALAKMNNAAMAREVASLAREILGGNGILHEHGVMRHLADIEAIYTYEGTHDINLLVVGREITGHSAFV